MQTDFRTIVKIDKFDFSVDVSSEVLLLGSCFSDNIGSRFVESRIRALVNPFGVVYNPLSIQRLLSRTMKRELCEEDELVFHNNRWHHFDFHGMFSGNDKVEVCEKINHAIESTHQFLKKSGLLIVTFGSSFVYERTDTSCVVANCHKFPNDFFSRYRLEPDEITSVYKDLIVALRVFNPGLKIVFTVSPVRHWKDGAHGNQLNKSVLFLAVNKLVEWFDGVSYFPAYEIVMDELRDYRFYDSGMFNPSDQAVDYIWQRFVEVLFTQEARSFVAQVSKIVRARNHCFKDAMKEEKILFFQKSLELIRNLKLQFPEANLSSDHDYFQMSLADVE